MNYESDAAHYLDLLRKLVDRVAGIEDVKERRWLSKQVLEVAGDVEFDWEQDHCLVNTGGRICGRSLEDGEGFDGKCGDHADQAEARGDYAHHD